MADKFKGFPARPNLQGYTPVPNNFFDEILPNIKSMSEIKILLAVFRKTYGWSKGVDENGQPIYKLEDAISYSQFETLTGLSNTSISNGISQAIKDGLLEKPIQGNSSGVTSRYRLVTEGRKQVKDSLIVTSTEDTKKPEPPKQAAKPTGIAYLEMGEDDEPLPKKVKGTSLTDIMSKPQAEENSTDDLLGEIFGGTSSQPKAEEKKKGNSPHHSLLGHWLSEYNKRFGTFYGNPNKKEHGHIKAMLAEHGLETMRSAITFYIQNYDKISENLNGFPTLSALYGWRKTIIPASLHGLPQPKPKPTTGRNKQTREFNESGWDDDDFFN